MTEITEMPDIEGPDLFPICKLGKAYGTVTCRDIMSHGGKWMVKKKGKTSQEKGRDKKTGR
jgi:hypothetical protein